MKKKKLKCENCSRKRLFKGTLCEDCWYKGEFKRLEQMRQLGNEIPNLKDRYNKFSNPNPYENERKK